MLGDSKGVGVGTSQYAPQLMRVGMSWRHFLSNLPCKVKDSCNPDAWHGCTCAANL